MHKQVRRLLMILMLSFSIVAINAQEHPAHEELRALKDTLIEAIKKGDIDAMLAGMHDEVVITWQNNRVCNGKQEVKAFYDEMTKSGNNKFEGYIQPPTADELTKLYATDQAGIVTGSTVARYTLLGKEIQLPSRWTATLIKKNDKWLLASYHISMNVLDNPLLNSFKKNGLLFGIGGIISGFLMGFIFKRKKAH